MSFTCSRSRHDKCVRLRVTKEKKQTYSRFMCTRLPFDIENEIVFLLRVNRIGACLYAVFGLYFTLSLRLRAKITVAEWNWTKLKSMAFGTFLLQLWNSNVRVKFWRFNCGRFELIWTKTAHQNERASLCTHALATKVGQLVSTITLFARCAFFCLLFWASLSFYVVKRVFKEVEERETAKSGSVNER